ncbi:MAG: HAD family phosphatase [Anaerolineales bacterium]|nr:HAD family phosphatase [Anaerolineales bacterium]
MSIQAVYWDIGGVLVRTGDRLPRTVLARRLGMSYQDLETLVFNSEIGRKAQRGEITEPERWNSLVGELGIAAEEVPAVRQAFFGGDFLDEALVTYIRSLKPRCKLGVISNAMGGARHFIEVECGLAGLFDHLTFSAEVGVMKPDARIFQHALAGLGVEPAQAVFVDDFLHNIQAARALGMLAVHFQTPAQAVAELEQILTA